MSGYVSDLTAAAGAVWMASGSAPAVRVWRQTLSGLTKSRVHILGVGPAKPTCSASGKYVSYVETVAPGGGKASEVVEPAKDDADCADQGTAAAKGRAPRRRNAETILEGRLGYLAAVNHHHGVFMWAATLMSLVNRDAHGARSDFLSRVCLDETVFDSSRN